jgi:hypothetical protein
MDKSVERQDSGIPRWPAAGVITGICVTKTAETDVRPIGQLLFSSTIRTIFN